MEFSWSSFRQLERLLGFNETISINMTYDMTYEYQNHYLTRKYSSKATTNGNWWKIFTIMER